MDDFENVLCLCPSARLSLASLVLSTWTRVRQFVLTDVVPEAQQLLGYSAVIVMDRFATRPLVEQLATRLPVFVLAWNDFFEIVALHKTLRGIDVVYMGTSDTLEDDVEASDIRYIPIINARCAFARWSDLYESRSQFTVIGSASYRARWLRARLLGRRTLDVMVSAVGTFRRPPVLRKTLESAVVSNKLVWAGNCALDLPALGLDVSEQHFIESGIEAARAQASPSDRLRAALELMHTWNMQTAGSSRAHLHAFYVSNTLLRWAVLGYFLELTPQAAWFFGKDNLGLGLPFELYVHNLVPNERIAFLELGGKASESTIYPRALHLLARRFYVIPVPSSGTDAIASTVERIARGLANRTAFFAELERRRVKVYGSLPVDCELRVAQSRVWADFANAALDSISS